MKNSEVKTGDCFQLKSDFLALTVVKLTSVDIEALRAQLDETIEKAPKYFSNSPVILDVQAVARDAENLNLAEMIAVLREKKILPVGIRGLKPSQAELAHAHGLAYLKSTASIIENVRPIAPPAPKATPTPAPPALQPAKIITKPIRAGATVYAPGSDLIILSAVNAGAECIADGNIHIYGPLRGRALAGAKGNTQARIFCRSLEAELISIAGHYLVKEDIQSPKTDLPTLQIYLKDKTLIIEGI